MEKLRPIYRDVKDWAILDTRIVNDFSEDENPIEAVEVLIGTLHYEYLDFNQNYIERRTPIIRWISKSEYNRLYKNEGVAIW